MFGQRRYRDAQSPSGTTLIGLARVALLLASLGCSPTGANGPAIPGPRHFATPPEGATASPPSPGVTAPRPEPDERPQGRSVKILNEPMNAVHLLTRIERPHAADCESILIREAETLGADFLFIDRSAPICRGAAYRTQDSSVVHSEDPPEAYPDTLRRWLHTRWRRPAGISDEEIAKLCVVTRFWTNSQLRIWKVLRVPARSSGNSAFDESVWEALDSAIDERAPIPEPQAIPIRRNVRNAVVTLAFSVGEQVDCSADRPFAGAPVPMR